MSDTSSKLGVADRRFEKAFMKALRRSLPQRITDSAALAQKIGTDAKDQWHADPKSYQDEATRGHHWAACLVLAADRILRASLPDHRERRMAIESALLEPGARQIRFFTRLMLLFSQDRFKTLADYAERRVPPRYGGAFSFMTLESTNDAFVQGVSKCFYNDYFRAHGAPDLIQVFCAFDKLWIDEIKASRDKVRFDRPTTLANGDDFCRFAFKRVNR